MRPLLLACALVGCAARAPAPPSAGAAAEPTSAVSFGARAAPAPTPDGALLPLGGGALPASAAGQERLPPEGRRISLDLVEADLHHVLRLLSDVADIDFVVDDGVQATVTVQMSDVPWNYALAAILVAHGLAARPLAGGGVRVVAPGG